MQSSPEAAAPSPGPPRWPWSTSVRCCSISARRRQAHWQSPPRSSSSPTRWRSWTRAFCSPSGRRSRSCWACPCSRPQSPHRGRCGRSCALLAASAAAEVALLPLGPLFFSRVTRRRPAVQLRGRAAHVDRADWRHGCRRDHRGGAVPRTCRGVGAAPGRRRRWSRRPRSCTTCRGCTWRVPAPSLLLVALYYCGLVVLVSARVWVRWTAPMARHGAPRRPAPYCRRCSC